MEKLYDFIKKSIDQERLSHSYLFISQDVLLIHNSLDKISALMMGVDNEEFLNRAIFSERIIVGDMIDQVIERKEIKKILDFSNLKPIFSKRRLVVIKNVHLLTLSAANNLLKIIEEPPAHVIFFLITDRPDLLIKTIISRCTIIKNQRGYLSNNKLLYNNETFHDLHRSSLNKRFLLAEQLSKEEGNKIKSFLNEWLSYLINSLVNGTKNTKQKNDIKLIEEIRRAKRRIETTYINPRLMLERLFIKIDNSSN
ncbi:MAG: hypothetical protein WC242_04790 [Candidatus Paceibacterota bacterium]|jgi:hypothetical protein